MPCSPGSLSSSCIDSSSSSERLPQPSHPRTLSYASNGAAAIAMAGIAKRFSEDCRGQTGLCRDRNGHFLSRYQRSSGRGPRSSLRHLPPARLRGVIPPRPSRKVGVRRPCMILIPSDYSVRSAPVGPRLPTCPGRQAGSLAPRHCLTHGRQRYIRRKSRTMVIEGLRAAPVLTLQRANKGPWEAVDTAQDDIIPYMRVAKAPVTVKTSLLLTARLLRHLRWPGLAYLAAARLIESRRPGPCAHSIFSFLPSPPLGPDVVDVS
ncbi:hypothetical protein GGR56DRAFT_430713 [Xylariaceae sp. FL0804]|nr:hypothetical protein GGR56DRAFT_430713 [Xylariaceae sp. FL0804]